MNIFTEKYGEFKIFGFSDPVYIDATSIDDIKEKLIDDINKNNIKLALDFQNVIHIDSSGLGGLIEVTKLIKTKKGKFYLLHISESIMEILIVTKLSSFFSIVNSKEEIE